MGTKIEISLEKRLPVRFLKNFDRNSKKRENLSVLEIDYFI